MARMHTRRKGKSCSKRPMISENPAWVPVPNVKLATGKTITQIMEEKGVAGSLPEDLANLMRRAIDLNVHLRDNRGDVSNKRGLNMIEAKIRRLERYYKRNGVLPADWKLQEERCPSRRLEVQSQQRGTHAQVSPMEDKVPSKLLTTLSKAADIVRGHDFIQVFSHYDADGVSSAAILAKTLLRAGKEFRVTLFTTLNDYNMDVIRNTKADCIIISDLGASYIDQLDEMDCDIVVLDHHTIISEAKRVCYANPHLYGIDGMTSGCGATMCLLFSVTMDENNWDLVQIAFAGIAGDRQHINGLSGLNTYLLEEGTKRGYIERMQGSLIPAGDLQTELFLVTDPYIRGVSGSVEGVAKLMSDAGIPNGKTFMDLTEEERRRLSSLIAIKLTEQGVQLSSMNEIARDRYYLTGMKMDAEYLSAILNNCGRSGIGGIGIAAGMGDERCINEGAKQNQESAKLVVESMVDLDRRGLTQMEHIQWFDSTDSGFTGMLCGIAMQSIGDHSKPTIGMNKSNDPVNLSSRGMWCQLDRGVDLAKAMREACASVGGQGGGHKIAAGGSVPLDRVDEFLQNLDRIIGEQISSAM